MSRQSSLTIAYKDLLDYAEKALAASEKKLAGGRSCGAYNLEA